MGTIPDFTSEMEVSMTKSEIFEEIVHVMQHESSTVKEYGECHKDFLYVFWLWLVFGGKLCLQGIAR